MINNDLTRIYVNLFPNYLGIFYSTVTDFLGFNVNEGEFKVMGIAGYGMPIHKNYIL